MFLISGRLLEKEITLRIEKVRVHWFRGDQSLFVLFSSFKSLSLCVLWTTACRAFLSITIFWNLLKRMSIKAVMPSTIWSSIIQFSSCLQSSNIRVLSNESFLCIRWPKFRSFSFSISPSSQYSGLISFRIDWFDLVVQGTLKSVLESSKASLLWRSAFSHDYWKNHSFDDVDLCRQSNVSAF